MTIPFLIAESSVLIKSEPFRLLVFGLASTAIMSTSYNNVYAHSFYNNQASVFFTLAKKFEVEHKLVQDNFPSNVSIALNHSENAASILKDIVSFKKEIRNDTDFLTNTSLCCPTLIQLHLLLSPQIWLMNP
jgi:hypothetical protein